MVLVLAVIRPVILHARANLHAIPNPAVSLECHSESRRRRVRNLEPTARPRDKISPRHSPGRNDMGG